MFLSYARFNESSVLRRRSLQGISGITDDSSLCLSDVSSSLRKDAPLIASADVGLNFC